MSMVQRVIRYVRMHGAGYTLHRAGEMLSQRVWHTYDRRFRREAPDAEALAYQRDHQPDAGLISVAVPVYNTRPAFLHALADSLHAQTYQAWEAVLYDGGSTDRAAIAAMDKIAGDRIRVIHSGVNEGISGNTNRAIGQCRGGYIALCDHDDVLAPEALWRVAEAIAAQQPDMLYSDEDRLTEDGKLHTDPHHKTDFCPDNLRSGNYVCHLMVIKRGLLEHLGGLRPDYDGSQDHDLALRITEATQRICHIPRTLYHWRMVGTSMSRQQLSRCQDAAARAVAEHMARIGYPGTCTVEDGVLRLRYDVPEGLRVATIRVPAEGGYAYMNRAAREATEDVLLFVHEAVSGLPEGFVQELLMYAQRDDVGAVTPMMHDRRGRVTHAGFTLQEGRIVGRNTGLPWHAGGWHGMNRTSHNVLAVSAACFMIRRDHYIPFDETWPDGLGAVDWCLRLRARGLRCVYTPHARAECSATELLSRFTEQQRLLRTWPDMKDECSGRP